VRFSERIALEPRTSFIGTGETALCGVKRVRQATSAKEVGLKEAAEETNAAYMVR